MAGKSISVVRILISITASGYDLLFMCVFKTLRSEPRVSQPHGQHRELALLSISRHEFRWLQI